MREPRPELLALLQAVKQQPDDDSPRLVLADWLEEYGDEADRARAEFVRLHCAWSQLDWRDPAREEPQRRGQALLDEHRQAWRLPLGDRQTWWDFHRGLPYA